MDAVVVFRSGRSVPMSLASEGSWWPVAERDDGRVDPAVDVLPRPPSPIPAGGLSSVDAILIGTVVLLAVLFARVPTAPVQALVAFATAALLVRPRRPRPDRPWAWAMFAVAASVYGVGSLVAPSADVPLGRLALTSSAGLALLIGTWLLGRHRDGHASGAALVDALAIGATAGVVLWTVLALRGSTGVASLVSPLELGIDLAALAQVVYLHASRRHRSTALRLLAAGLAVGVLGDVGSALGPAGILPLPALLLAAFGVVPFVLWSGAALDPSRSALGPGVAVSRAFSVRRVGIGVAVVLLDPVLAVVLVRSGDLVLLPPLVALHVAMITLVMSRMVGMARRVGAQAAELRHLVDVDQLTGLESPRAFTQRLTALLAERPDPVDGPPRIMLAIGFGGIRELNETLGREVADGVLAAGAAVVVRAVGAGSVVARTGAAELAALLPVGTSAADADALALGVRSAVSEPRTVRGVSIPPDVAVGVLAVTSDCPDARSLLRRSGHTIGAARETHSGVAWFGAGIAEEAVLAAELIGELADAMAAGQLVVHYQPQVHLGTGRVTGAEALVRWRHPTRGLLSPATFVPAAERTGLMRLLTLVVLEQAIAQGAAWAADDRDLTVAVNLSARSLVDPRLVDDVRMVLATHGFPANRLELEITETAAMIDPAFSASVLDGLAALGVTLAVDDYGTGYGSLAYLQRVPVSRLKIDRSFVTALTSDAVSAAIVRSTIELAHELGLGVVAEGVEDEAVLDALRSMGCDVAQGFGLGRPVPGPATAAEFERIEARWSAPVVPRQGRR